MSAAADIGTVDGAYLSALGSFPSCQVVHTLQCVDCGQVIATGSLDCRSEAQVAIGRGDRRPLVVVARVHELCFQERSES